MQCFDEVAAMPIVIHQVTKNAEILPTQYIDKVATVFMVITSTGPSTVAQPCDQECRDSAGAAHRQGHHGACCDTATGPSTVAQPGDQARQDSTAAVHRRGRRYVCSDAATDPRDTEKFEVCESPAGAVRRDNGDAARDHADHAAHFPEEVETNPQERIWGIFEDVPVPDASGDATSLPPSDGVAGALAWLSRRPARSEQPLVQHTSHGHRLRWAHAASSRW